MTTEIVKCTEPWYSQLIDELQDIITEAVFTHTWALVEGYHMVGTRILQEYENFQRLRMPDSELVKQVALSLNKNKRTIYYAIQFARKYPDLNLLPEGKNCNWHKIITKYLTSGDTEKKIIKSPALMIKEIKKLLETEYLKAHQEAVECGAVIENDQMCSFIRYLQDQFDKITTGVEI